MMKKITFLMLLIISISAKAQTDLTRPQASQAASVMQRIGITDVTIKYNSPLAKGRKIWGDLVPYNEVWRAGANENTTISFSSDVKIEGKDLKAGTYGLHMIPTEKQWTIIFSKDANAWGSFFYDKNHDALRVDVNSRVGENQDWLSYSFSNPQAESTTAELRWEKLIIPIKINVNVNDVVVESMRTELTNINGFFWQGFNQAAAFCITNNTHLDDASKWIDKSLSLQKNFTNTNTKARLLAKQGKTAEAEALKKEALTLADEVQLNAFGYELMGQGKMNEAIDIFRTNVKRYPSSWNTYDSLAEALEKSGDVKSAVANYKTALGKCPEAQKKRITDTIKKLESKS